MAEYRKISDYLKSGEVDRIRISDNIQFDKANVPEADGMFARFGAGGLLTAYRAQDQDKHWEDSHITDVEMSSTENQLLSVTIDDDLLPEDSSYQLSFVATNTNGWQAKEMTIHIFDDNTEVDTIDVSVPSNSSHQLYVFSGTVKVNWDTGSVLAFRFSGNDDITLNGADTPIKIILTKAQAAAI